MLTTSIVAALIVLATNAWAPVPPMSTPRAGHTATLLPDGRVLVAGGTNGTETSTAEIFDPLANAWSAAASMSTPRRNHTATLLKDGTVLVVGGAYKVDGIKTYLASAEIFDPSAGSWRPASALTTERAYHSATLLTDGRVLVAAGANLGDLDSAEIYDPVPNAWTATGRLSVRRYDHAAVALSDGTVVVLGGYSSKLTGSDYTATVERFDSANATWSIAGQLLSERAQAAVSLLPDGRILLAGGQASAGDLGSVEAFDPRAGASEARPALASARRAATATALAGGDVLVTGGYFATAYGNAVSVVTAQRYDSGRGSWADAGALQNGRASHTSTRLLDGRVLVVGGFDDNYLASAELWSAEASSAGPAGGGGCSSGAAFGIEALVLVIGLLLRPRRC